MNAQIEILEAGTPPRPTLTAEMREEAIHKMVADHPGAFGDAPDAAEQLVATLARRFRGHEDGYELGKAIERDGWEVDAQVVQALDDLSLIADGILREAVKAWVSGFDITPPHRPGTRVTWKQRGKQVSGTVLEHDIEYCDWHALYLLVEDGRDYPGNGTGTLVAYELCSLEQPAEVSAQ